MGFYRHRNQVVTAYTFDEFVAYGRKVSDSMQGEVPWAFDFHGHRVTHEYDSRYHISDMKGWLTFSRGFVIKVDAPHEDGCAEYLTVLTEKAFHESFEPIPESESDSPEPESAVAVIAAERASQVADFGYTADRDDAYNADELAEAAVCYIRAAGVDQDRVPDGVYWPFPNLDWKPTSRKRNLIKAAALLAAEIDRITRLEGRSSAACRSADVFNKNRYLGRADWVVDFAAEDGSRDVISAGTGGTARRIRMGSVAASEVARTLAAPKAT